MALCHTCCTRYSSTPTPHTPPLFCLRTHPFLVPLFALLIKQLQASAFIWQSFDVSPHRLHWHPFHGKLLHRLPLRTPLPLSPLQAPAVRTCLALPLSHSTAEAQPTGQLPLSNFHMQSQLTFCGCHSKWHNLTPPHPPFPPLTIQQSMAKLYLRPPPAVPHPCSFAPV